MKYKKLIKEKFDIRVACLVGENSVILPGVKMDFGSRCGALTLLRGTIPKNEL